MDESYGGAAIFGLHQVSRGRNFVGDRGDGVEFLEIAPKIPIGTMVHTYPLAEANQALRDLKGGKFAGAAVLLPQETQSV